MTVKELFEKYCSKDKWGYCCNGHSVNLTPASEEEIKAFRDMCAKFGVEERIVSELEEYYRQTNNFLGYFNCDDLCLFDWWEGDEQKSIWLGCLDDDSFIYDSLTGKYAIGEAGDNSLGEYDTLMEMLEAYLKEGYENGWNN